MRRSIRFLRKGRLVDVSAFEPRTSLLDWLRLEESSTGTKEGCNEGDCGACTVVLARNENGILTHRPVCACITMLGQVDGAELLTVEDLGTPSALHPVQEAMVQHHGAQCGFCTPGIVMSLFALYQDGARPVMRQAVLDQLAGNLCRCTGYRPIVTAALEACAGEPADGFALRAADRSAALAGLNDGADILVGTDERFFAAPARLDTALTHLARHPDSTILAGATDVGLWVTKQLRELPRILWLGRVAELAELKDGPDALTLGGGVRLADATVHLAAIDPDLGELMRRFGSVQIRAAGTVGGNIANGSPIGDLAPALIALGATLHLRQAGKGRELPLERFFLAYGKQDRAPAELVTAVSVPKLGSSEHFRCLKLTKRFDEDISAVMAAVKLTLTGRQITAARIAFGGMAATPKRAGSAEAALVGASVDDPGAWEPAVEVLAADFQPISDMRASADYRMDGARALLRKALVEIAGGASVKTRLNGHRPAEIAAE